MDGGQYGDRVISEGNRNATMSRFAGKVIKKYGDTDEAYQCFSMKPPSAIRLFRTRAQIHLRSAQKFTPA